MAARKWSRTGGSARGESSRAMATRAEGEATTAAVHTEGEAATAGDGVRAKGGSGMGVRQSAGREANAGTWKAVGKQWPVRRGREAGILTAQALTGNEHRGMHPLSPLPPPSTRWCHISHPPSLRADAARAAAPPHADVAAPLLSARWSIPSP